MCEALQHLSRKQRKKPRGSRGRHQTAPRQPWGPSVPTALDRKMPQRGWSELKLLCTTRRIQGTPPALKSGALTAAALQETRDENQRWQRAPGQLRRCGARRDFRTPCLPGHLQHLTPWCSVSQRPLTSSRCLQGARQVALPASPPRSPIAFAGLGGTGQSCCPAGHSPMLSLLGEGSGV